MAACYSSYEVPAAPQQTVAAARAPQLQKDYSRPLHVDCSVEYELPNQAKPPAGVRNEPLLMIHPCYFRKIESQRRSPFVNNLPNRQHQLVAKRRLHQQQQQAAAVAAAAAAQQHRQQHALHPQQPQPQQQVAAVAATAAAVQQAPPHHHHGHAHAAHHHQHHHHQPQQQTAAQQVPQPQAAAQYPVQPHQPTAAAAAIHHHHHHHHHQAQQQQQQQTAVAVGGGQQALWEPLQPLPPLIPLAAGGAQTYASGAGKRGAAGAADPMLTAAYSSSTGSTDSGHWTDSDKSPEKAEEKHILAGKYRQYLRAHRLHPYVTSSIPLASTFPQIQQVCYNV